MNRTTLALATALALTPLTTHAADPPTTWTLLDAGHGVCRDARTFARVNHLPGYATPAAMESYERQLSIFSSKTIRRDDAGKIDMVLIIDNTGTAQMYFPSRGQCEAALQIGVDKGILTRPGELD